MTAAHIFILILFLVLPFFASFFFLLHRRHHCPDVGGNRWVCTCEKENRNKLPIKTYFRSISIVDKLCVCVYASVLCETLDARQCASVVMYNIYKVPLNRIGCSNWFDKFVKRIDFVFEKQTHTHIHTFIQFTKETMRWCGNDDSIVESTNSMTCTMYAVHWTCV